jgi:hypothetical protein
VSSCRGVLDTTLCDAVNDLPLYLHETISELYADDTTIHISNESVHLINNKFQNDLVQVKKWCKNNNIFCLPGKFNLDFYQGALPEVYVYLHYLDTRHQSRVVIHNEVMIVCGRTPLI